jgi:hypothetical protein
MNNDGVFSFVVNKYGVIRMMADKGMIADKDGVFGLNDLKRAFQYLFDFTNGNVNLLKRKVPHAEVEPIFEQFKSEQLEAPASEARIDATA